MELHHQAITQITDAPLVVLRIERLDFAREIIGMHQDAHAISPVGLNFEQAVLFSSFSAYEAVVPRYVRTKLKLQGDFPAEPEQAVPSSAADRPPAATRAAPNDVWLHDGESAFMLKMRRILDQVAEGRPLVTTKAQFYRMLEIDLDRKAVVAD